MACPIPFDAWIRTGCSIKILDSIHVKANFMIYKIAPSICKPFLVGTLLLLPWFLSAAGKAPYQPKLTNSKKGEIHDFPLGVLSATGRLADGETSILIKDVGKNGIAARSGIQVGDRILAINGTTPKAFSMKTDAGLSGPQDVLGRTLDATCASNQPRLQLKVRRGKTTLNLKLQLPRSPAFASSFPYNCAKSRTYLQSIAKHLEEIQRKDGSWRPGVGGDADIYTGAFCTLTLLASNQKAHLPAIRRAIDFIRKKSIVKINPKDPRVGPKNWQTATTAILLAEYQLATGDKTYFPDLKKSCGLLQSRVTERGTMGHHFAIPYNGGGLVIINTQAHLAWALASKCGYKIDRDAWDRSLKEVKASIHKKTGAIGYSSRAPGSPDIPARTGAMATALSLLEMEPKLTRQFAEALIEHQGRMRHAHAMSSIGLIYGIPSIQQPKPSGYKLVMRKWLPYLELCRTAEGPAMYFGGKRNIGGDQYLGFNPIGNAMVGLLLGSAEKKLFMHGGMRERWFGK